jgi:hypothetical protein
MLAPICRIGTSVGPVLEPSLDLSRKHLVLDTARTVAEQGEHRVSQMFLDNRNAAQRRDARSRAEPSS